MKCSYLVCTYYELTTLVDTFFTVSPEQEQQEQQEQQQLINS